MTARFASAQEFVGNSGALYFTVGRLQLELLQLNGCTPQSRVLEVGCGCLVAGRPIMQFLDADRYVGIEPNTWLIEAAREGLPDLDPLIAVKRPLFLSNDRFDASETGRRFDFVIAHSILSHAAHWQYGQLLSALAGVLAPGGVVLASIRFLDEHGRPVGNTNSPQWVYPGVSFFSWETAERVAIEHGYTIEWRRDYRDLFVRSAPTNHHDWIRLTR